MKVCCPCDELKHPINPMIPAGLSALPRQLAGFPEYRLAMLRDIPVYAPLEQWRARGRDDLGIMLLEMWAYVLDILGFYDERIANESYLRTAVLRPSLRKLVELIGYQARPALGASVVLAAVADGNRPVVLPPRTGFRSDAFDGEPPQVFETEVEHIIHSLKNEWTLGEVRDQGVSGDFLLDPATARISTGQLALLRWTHDGSIKQSARLVVRVSRIEALDGNAYLKVEFHSPPDLDSLGIGAVEILSPSLSASLNLTPRASLTSMASLNLAKNIEIMQETMILDSVYPQIGEKDSIIIQRGNELHAATIVSVGREDVTVSTVNGAPTIPATRITIDPALPSEQWSSSPERLRIHLGMVSAGRLTRIAKTHLDVTDFIPHGVPIEGLAEPIPELVAKPSELFLVDSQDNGTLAKGSVDIDSKGKAKVHLANNSIPFDPLLRTPVTVFGNLVRATRGESVFNEVLGSGDASQAFQSFIIDNNPLTYLNDPSVPNGRRSTLEVRVTGIKWNEVPSFFGAGPQDEVYIVRQNDEQESVVTFGDGHRGARLPTGIDNVTATYRFGAGAAKPPAGAIGQLARPVEGVRRMMNPIDAGGGADADRPRDIRRNAPNNALILGRAVSVQDFESLARKFGGVINAQVEWAWDEACQGAVVKVWFISDGGKIADQLRAFLIGQADPTTPLVAEEALAMPSEIGIDLEIDPRFNAQIIVEQVKQALINPEIGILALENIPIGCPLFRSRIFDAVLSVEGTRSVRAMTVDGQPAPFAITVAQGRYRNFPDGPLISGTLAP